MLYGICAQRLPTAKHKGPLTFRFQIDDNDRISSLGHFVIYLQGRKVGLGGVVLGQLPLGQLPLGQLPWGQLPRGRLPRRAITPLGQLPPGQLPPGQLPPRTITPVGQLPQGQLPLLVGQLPLRTTTHK